MFRTHDCMETIWEVNEIPNHQEKQRCVWSEKMWKMCGKSSKLNNSKNSIPMTSPVSCCCWTVWVSGWGWLRADPWQAEEKTGTTPQSKAANSFFVLFFHSPKIPNLFQFSLMRFSQTFLFIIWEIPLDDRVRSLWSSWQMKRKLHNFCTQTAGHTELPVSKRVKNQVYQEIHRSRQLSRIWTCLSENIRNIFRSRFINFHNANVTFFL